MSKIGKINISIPEKVKVILSGSDINIEGPIGKQSIKINLDVFDLTVNEGKDISIKPKKLDDTTKRLWGMHRSLINNAIIGSSVGFEKILELSGVGYRAAVSGRKLTLNLGLSHPVEMDIPEGIDIKMEGNTKMSVSGANKQMIGEFCSVIRSKRPPEPFKGKGIRYSNEYIIRKEGKKK